MNLDLSLNLSGTAYQDILPSPEEMAALDAASIHSGITSLELMERAGRRISEVIAQKTQLFPGPVTVLCGPGNNGGDGLVIARFLKASGWNVKVILVHADRYSKDLEMNRARFLSLGGEILTFPNSLDFEGLSKILRTSTLLIDALLGTGQKQAPRGALADMIRATVAVPSLSQKIPFCLAVDIPSGVNADTGQVFDPHIHANQTVSIELLKRGMLQYPAREACGDISAITIGIDPRLFTNKSCEFSLTHFDNVTSPPRAAHSHKGSFGHVLIIAGSLEMPGAPILAARAAVRTGAGLVSKLHFEGLQYTTETPEIMLQRLGPRLLPSDVPRVRAMLQQVSCAVVGPGLGMENETIEFVAEILRSQSSEAKPLVIDADALNVLALKHSSGENFTLHNSILTPHPAEAARLLGISTLEVQADRHLAAKKLAETFAAVVVLKGASSIVHEGKRGYVNTSGNPYMATGGSGDVLSGVIAALIAQNLSLLEAARVGVFLHGLAGDLAHHQSGGPIAASDIITQLPRAYARCLKK